MDRIKVGEYLKFNYVKCDDYIDYYGSQYRSRHGKFLKDYIDKIGKVVNVYEFTCNVDFCGCDVCYFRIKYGNDYFDIECCSYEKDEKYNNIFERINFCYKDGEEILFGDLFKVGKTKFLFWKNRIYKVPSMEYATVENCLKYSIKSGILISRLNNHKYRLKEQICNGIKND